MARKKRHKSKGQIWIVLLRPLRPFMEKILLKKNIPYDSTNEKSIYYEFFRNVVHKDRFEGIDNVKPTDPDYTQILSNVDWASIFNSIKAFFGEMVNETKKRNMNGDEPTPYEQEIIDRLKIIQQSLNDKKSKTPVNNINTKKLLIFGAIGYILLTQKK